VPIQGMVRNMKTRNLLCLSVIGLFGCGGNSEPVETAEVMAEADSVAVTDMTDERFQELLSRLQVQLVDSIDEESGDDADLHLWRFTNRLKQGILSDLQRQRAVGFIEGLMAGRPEGAEDLDKYLFMTQNLMIGDVAPNIVGADFEGVEFELADFRGKVTVLYFTGDWCGPCRSEYPYQKEMLETFADEAFAIIAVNSDGDPAEAKQAKSDNELPYPAWFDGGSTKGPIATRWGVTGWPTVYILDHKGVIRFAGRRHEATQLAAQYLLDEMKAEPGAP
jgi:thiol-disulfide isomerase/thioredoxin